MDVFDGILNLCMGKIYGFGMMTTSFASNDFEAYKQDAEA
jgi:hypothetical protein